NRTHCPRLRFHARPFHKDESPCQHSVLSSSRSRPTSVRQAVFAGCRGTTQTFFLDRLPSRSPNTIRSPPVMFLGKPSRRSKAHQRRRTESHSRLSASAALRPAGSAAYGGGGASSLVHTRDWVMGDKVVPSVSGHT